MLSSSYSTGDVVGRCTTCSKDIKVFRKSQVNNFNGDRLYAQCSVYGHGNFRWLTPITHVPAKWESCECGPMFYRLEDGRHMFKCWKTEAKTGCNAQKQVAYEPDTKHRSCIICNVEAFDTNTNLGNASNTAASPTGAQTVTDMTLPICSIVERMSCVLRQMRQHCVHYSCGSRWSQAEINSNPLRPHLL